MAIKVYSLPADLAAPEPDYRNYNFEEEQRKEEKHKEMLIKHFKGLGYTGKYSGHIYREPWADGHAQYMIIDAPRGSNVKEKFFLIHLPYGDGYHSPNVPFLTKTEIINRIKKEKKFEVPVMKLIRG